MIVERDANAHDTYVTNNLAFSSSFEGRNVDFAIGKGRKLARFSKQTRFILHGPPLYVSPNIRAQGGSDPYLFSFSKCSAKCASELVTLFVIGIDRPNTECIFRDFAHRASTLARLNGFDSCLRMGL